MTEKKPTGKRAARRKSYCARSAGQMKKFPKAAKDPNSQQARRRCDKQERDKKVEMLMAISRAKRKRVVKSCSLVEVV